MKISVSALALAWILLCSAAFYAAIRNGAKHPARVSICWVLGIALMVRVIPALDLRQGAAYEMAVFQDTGSRLLAGENVAMRLPYLPSFVYWMGLSDWLSGATGLHFTFWIKLPSIVADVSMISILSTLLVSIGWPIDKVRMAAILYAVNPVTILVSAYHGQFDVVPTALLMLALTFLLTGRSEKHPIAASLSLGLGILLKTWPGLLSLCVLVRQRFRHKVLFLVGSAVVPFLGTLATVLALGGGQLSDLLPVARRALQAGAVPGWWGYTGLINGIRWLAGGEPLLFDGLVKYKLPIVLVPVLIAVTLTRRLDLRNSIFWTLVCLFVVAPGFGLQSLCWLVPLFVVRDDRRDLAWYVGLGALHMVVSYWGIHLSPNLNQVLAPATANGIVQLSSTPVWLYLLSMLLRRFCVTGAGIGSLRRMSGFVSRRSGL